MNDSELAQLEASDKRRAARVLELEARIVDLEERVAASSRPRIAVSMRRWLIAYALFVVNQYLAYWDIRQWIGLTAIPAAIIGTVLLTVAGWLFLTGTGIMDK